MSSDAASDGVTIRAPAATAAALMLESAPKFDFAGIFFKGTRDFTAEPGDPTGDNFDWLATEEASAFAVEGTGLFIVALEVVPAVPN